MALAYGKGAFFDLDGTLINNTNCWSQVHEHYRVQELAKRNYEAFLRKEFDYRDFMERDIGSWLRGGKRIHIREIHEIFSATTLMPGAVELGEYLRKEGYFLAIISGGFYFVAAAVAKRIGAEFVQANGFELDDNGYLTGKPIYRVNPWEKGVKVREVFAATSADPEKCIAVGNDKPDISMLEVVGTPIGFNPTAGSERDLSQACDVVIKEKNLERVIDFLEELKRQQSIPEGVAISV